MHKLQTEILSYVSIMVHDGSLLPAYFAERESDSFFMPCFLMKIQYITF